MISVMNEIKNPELKELFSGLYLSNDMGLSLIHNEYTYEILPGSKRFIIDLDINEKEYEEFINRNKIYNRIIHGVRGMLLFYKMGGTRFIKALREWKNLRSITGVTITSNDNSLILKDNIYEFTIKYDPFQIIKETIIPDNCYIVNDKCSCYHNIYLFDIFEGLYLNNKYGIFLIIGEDSVEINSDAEVIFTIYI